MSDTVPLWQLEAYIFGGMISEHRGNTARLEKNIKKLNIHLTMDNCQHLLNYADAARSKPAVLDDMTGYGIDLRPYVTMRNVIIDFIEKNNKN